MTLSFEPLVSPSQANDATFAPSLSKLKGIERAFAPFLAAHRGKIWVTSNVPLRPIDGYNLRGTNGPRVNGFEGG